jgi:hypothetical protein
MSTLHFHGDEAFFYNPEYAFKRVPDGRYEVRTTVTPDMGETFEPFDFFWPTELKDGTLTPLRGRLQDGRFIEE